MEKEFSLEFLRWIQRNWRALTAQHEPEKVFVGFVLDDSANGLCLAFAPWTDLGKVETWPITTDMHEAFIESAAAIVKYHAKRI